MMDGYSAATSSDGDENGMCSVTELVEGPKGVIPSFVRLERAKKRYDVRRQIFASTPNVVLHVSGSVPKRKLSTLRLGDACESRSGVPGLIKSGSESVKSLSGVVCANVRDRLVHSEFMKLKAIRVFLNDLFVWYIFKEFSDSHSKLFARNAGPPFEIQDLSSVSDLPKASFGNEGRQAQGQSEHESESSKAIEGEAVIYSS